MRTTSSPFTAFVVALLGLAAGCGSESNNDEPGDPVDAAPVDDPQGADYRVAGTVVDFATGIAVADQATITTLGLTPPPAVVVQGANFAIDDVPPHSVFHILAGSPAAYTNTFGAAVEVVEQDVEGTAVQVVSTADLSAAAEAFGVSPSATSAILFARAVDREGAALADVPAEAFQVNSAVPLAGPFFLGPDLKPDPALTATSSSGYAVFFEVPPGLVSLTAAPNSGLTMTMAASPAAAGAITLAVVEVVAGAGGARPSGVSFSGDIVPMFVRRGCETCHSKGEIGRDLGDLELSGKQVYAEVTTEVSPSYGVARVNLASPADSLILTQPSAEDPADTHPNITFASSSDPDYLKLLVWIEEGALDN
jgi:hypothetical protein